MSERNHGTVIIAEEYFNGDIILTDPCYIIPDDHRDDWQNCCYGDDMFCLGFKHYLCEMTLEGDWHCEVFLGTGSRMWYQQKAERKIGEFAADACKTGIFYLHEILKYNPQFDYHISKPWCACWIKKYQGTVKIVTKLDPDGDESMHIIGLGNKSFFSRESYWSNIFPCKKSEKV